MRSNRIRGEFGFKKDMMANGWRRGYQLIAMRKQVKVVDIFDNDAKKLLEAKR